MATIRCGCVDIQIRKLPGFEQLGVAKIGKEWRFVDLEDTAVIGAPMETYALAIEYADHFYVHHYN